MSRPCTRHSRNLRRVSEASDGIEAAALRAEAWAGEPFLRPDEDAATSLRARDRAAPRARQRARRDRGRPRPSPRREWKVRFALMLGLERVLSEKPPHLASGTELRRHQVDALAGMLTELIAANEKQVANGDGAERRAPPRSRSRRTTRTRTTTSPVELDEDERRADEDAVEAARTTPAPSAATASATRPPPARRSPPPGFVEAARTEGVLILTHRRLLVDQFRRELTEHGYGERLTEIDPRQARGRSDAEPDHDPDLRLVRAPRRRDLARRPTSS